MSKDTVLVSMALLGFMVALNEEWLYYLKGWVSASVGGVGASGLANTAPNQTAPTQTQYTQPGATSGTALVNSPRPTSIGNQNL